MNNGILTIDVECSGALRNKAHPFDPRNKLLLVGLRTGKQNSIFDIDYTPAPYGNHIRTIQSAINSSSMLVGFNIKYDIHWLRNYGVTIPKEKMIWDCQLAEFILSNQTITYPDLADSCIRRGLVSKKNTLSQYLDSGVDVCDIPLPELTEYLEGDLISTEALHFTQKGLLSSTGKFKIFNIQCQDLMVLQEMEYNGMKYDLQTSSKLAKECFDREVEIKIRLNEIMGLKCINWASNDHLSTVLYGGTIKEEIREVVGVFKTGQRAGQDKYGVRVVTHTFPRLVEPLRGSDLAKPGYWSTAADVLSELKASGKAKEIIKLVRELSDLEKLRGTYYEGIPKKFTELGWEHGIMHGQLNQVVARTGRTSSSKPNLQNIPERGKICFHSRYG